MMIKQLFSGLDFWNLITMVECVISGHIYRFRKLESKRIDKLKLKPRNGRSHAKFQSVVFSMDKPVNPLYFNLKSSQPNPIPIKEEIKIKKISFEVKNQLFGLGVRVTPGISYGEVLINHLPLSP